MERAINRLFDIEEEAAIIISRASEEKLRLNDEFEAGLIKMENEINTEYEGKINEFRNITDNELENEKKQLAVKSEKQLKELEDIYRRSHEVIAEKVFRNIIQI